MLMTNEVREFHERGYLAVRRAIAPDLLDRLRRATDEMVEESRERTASDDVFELEPDHSAERPRLRRIHHPVLQRLVYWEAATCEAVLDCVETLIGPNIRFHHSKLNVKVGDGGAEIGWHQDFAFFPHTNFDLVACGIALDDALLENGCLLVVPGTQRLPVLDHRLADGDFVGMITSDKDRFDAGAAVPVELRAGDMSIHHVNVVHGSAVNRSPRPRRLLIFQYAACDAIQLDYRPPANEFAGRVVRGRPATHARLAGAMSLPLRGDLKGSLSLFDRQRLAMMKG